MSLDDYDNLLKSQDFTSKICKKPVEETTRQRLVVDHCHKTHRIRGLLCDRCNLLIGHIEYHNLLVDILEYLNE